MSEVSCRAFAPALAAIEQRGLSLATLTDGLPVSPHHLAVAKNRVTWDLLVALAARLESMFGSRQALEAVYRDHLQSARYSFFPAVLKLLLNPRDIYWAGTAWFGPSLFSIIDGQFEELADGRLRETLVIPECYADCPQLFALMRGGLEATPGLVGLPNAKVEMSVAPRRVVYTITPPTSRPRIGSRVVEIFTRRRAIAVFETLSAQQEQVHENFETIAERDEALYKMNRELLRKNEELEDRVRERTASLEQANAELTREIKVGKQATMELARSRERVRDTERLASMGTLAAGIAHEINNPIAAILLAAQYARSSHEQRDALETYRGSMSDIEREAKRCGTIVKSMLQFARDEPTAKWAAKLNDVIHRALTQVEPLAEQRGAHVEESVCQEAIYVRVNPMQIEQTITNLLRNAIESSDDTPNGVEVTLGLEARDGRAFVTVEDNGSGISDDIRTRIFDPFFTTRRPRGQMGLGLSVVHGIVSEHAGKIEIESKDGSGTRVSIELETCSPEPHQVEDG